MNFPKRNIQPNEIIMDFPEELGYGCPHNSKHKINWSEYEAHIWCYDCQRDYPSCFCKDDFQESIEVFYSTFEHLIK